MTAALYGFLADRNVPLKIYSKCEKQFNFESQQIDVVSFLLTEEASRSVYLHINLASLFGDMPR